MCLSFFRRPSSPGRRLGFTLVELLVVIAIIGILVSMLAAIWGAMAGSGPTPVSRHLIGRTTYFGGTAPHPG